MISSIALKYQNNTMIESELTIPYGWPHGVGGRAQFLKAHSYCQRAVYMAILRPYKILAMGLVDNVWLWALDSEI